MTHRTTADYYAGIPQYGAQLAAENDRLRTAIREAKRMLTCGEFDADGRAFAILTNALNVEGANP